MKVIATNIMQDPNFPVKFFQFQYCLGTGSSPIYMGLQIKAFGSVLLKFIKRPNGELFISNYSTQVAIENCDIL